MCHQVFTQSETATHSIVPWPLYWAVCPLHAYVTGITPRAIRAVFISLRQWTVLKVVCRLCTV